MENVIVSIPTSLLMENSNFLKPSPTFLTDTQVTQVLVCQDELTMTDK